MTSSVWTAAVGYYTPAVHVCAGMTACLAAQQPGMLLLTSPIYMAKVQVQQGGKPYPGA